jgi:hypothetical protein
MHGEEKVQLHTCCHPPYKTYVSGQVHYMAALLWRVQFLSTGGADKSQGRMDSELLEQFCQQSTATFLSKSGVPSLPLVHAAKKPQFYQSELTYTITTSLFLRLNNTSGLITKTCLFSSHPVPFNRPSVPTVKKQWLDCILGARLSVEQSRGNSLLYIVQLKSSACLDC